MKKILTLCLTVLLFSTTFAKDLANNPDRLERFQDLAVGMFIHWSLDSQLGSVISHSMVGASDDYLERFINDLPTTFYPYKYNPSEWARLAKVTGIKYMVYTTKHHSGFCMWDTKTSDFNIMKTPYNKDTVQPFVDACREFDLDVGFYFSPEDFHFNYINNQIIRRRGMDYTDKFTKKQEQFLIAQSNELSQNFGEIDVLFIDGVPAEPVKNTFWKNQPNCVITRGAMETPEQHLPDEPLPGPWEACFTMGTQWQFKPTNEHYKSGQTLIQMLIETRAKGGNLLINVGPTPEGEIPFEQSRRLRELGLWLFTNHEAIYKVRPCPKIRQDDIWFTKAKDKNTVFAFLTNIKDWKRGDRKEFFIKTIESTDHTRISVLGQNSEIIEYNPKTDATSRFTQTDEGLNISVVRAQRLYNNHEWPNPVVVKIENVKFIDE